MKAIQTILLLFILLSCKQNKSSENLPKQKKDANEFVVRKLTAAEKQLYLQKVKGMYDTLLLRRNFNGSIIVAKNNEILFEDYHGYADFSTKDTITPETSFHLASVSKTFTGTAILKLWEEKKLQLDDSVQVYFPAFPYHNITVRMLLNHRSGLPNYIYAMVKNPYWKKHLADNNDMLQFLISEKPTWYGYPNRAFNYCNTNYALLALIIEKVSGMSYADYLSKTIFQPLGMTHTFVFTKSDSLKYKPSFQYNNRPFNLEPMDAIYGDKNIYSTARDMFLWDRALYNNKIISKATFEQAIQPSSFEKPGIHNYGMGWRLIEMPTGKVVFHNGWWHGNNNVFARLIDDTATIIILGNRFNKAIYSGMKLATIFANSTKTEVLDPLE